MAFIKNIETKIRIALWVALGSFVTAITVSTLAFSYAAKMVRGEQHQIYVLDKNIPLLATKTDMEDNREAEYRADIEAFHNYFFTLPPDGDYIERQLGRAMYLVDATGQAQYGTLKEKGYYTNLVTTSSVSTCTMDSIRLDMNTGNWTYYGKQKIERPSMVNIRSLITSGGLQDVPRTVNNPHGVLITNWKTLENKDLQNVTKKVF